MSDIIINLALIILSSMYFGVIIGRQGNKKAFEERIEKATDEVKQQAEQHQRDLAVELHGELTKIRDGIIDSAPYPEKSEQANSVRPI